MLRQLTHVDWRYTRLFLINCAFLVVENHIDFDKLLKMLRSRSDTRGGRDLWCVPDASCHWLVIVIVSYISLFSKPDRKRTTQAVFVESAIIPLGLLSEFRGGRDQKGACLREMPQESWEICPLETRKAGVRGIWNTSLASLSMWVCTGCTTLR